MQNRKMQSIGSDSSLRPKAWRAGTAILFCALAAKSVEAFGVGSGLPMLRPGRASFSRGPMCSSGAGAKKKMTRAEKEAASRAAKIKTEGEAALGPADMSRHIKVDLGHRGIKLVHMDPPIFTIDGFFTDKECEKYISAGTDGEESGDSYQVASATFGGAATASNRRSTTWYLKYEKATELVDKAMKLLPGVELEHCEEPQIVRYEMGDFFSWHEDKVPPEQLSNGGQRVATLLVYLNDMDKSGGGATQFKDLPVKVTPKRGTALLFFPAFADGQPDSRTVHAGSPCFDVKWIAQMWVHQSAYKPAVPPGNSHDAIRKLLS